MWPDDLVPPDKKVQKGKLYLVSLGKAKETRNEQVICSPDADTKRFSYNHISGIDDGPPIRLISYSAKLTPTLSSQDGVILEEMIKKGSFAVIAGDAKVLAEP